MYDAKPQHHPDSGLLLAQMTVRDALNSAMDEEMEKDKDVFILGEEVRQGLIASGRLLRLHLCPGLFTAASTARCRSRHSVLIHCCWLQVGEYQGAYKVLDPVFSVAAWCG
jgi:hypothetical protein